MKENKPSGYWQLKDNCRSAARKCKSRSDMQKRFSAAYNSSSKNGWLDEFFPNSTTKRGKKFWTKETCQEEAKKYKSAGSFSKKSNRAYRVCLDNGWLDEFFPERRKTHFAPKKIWTKEECAAIAAQCKTRNEFCAKKASAYRFAQQQGWLDEICGIKNQMTKERCRKTAEYFKTPAKMRQFAPTVYKTCVLNDWLEEFFPKMVKKEPDPKQKTIRSMILDYVAANGSQTKKDLYRVMLTIAGQNINRKGWGICYMDNVSYGTSIFLPARADKRYLKQVRGFDFKEPRYDLTTANHE